MCRFWSVLGVIVVLGGVSMVLVWFRGRRRFFGTWFDGDYCIMFLIALRVIRLESNCLVGFHHVQGSSRDRISLPGSPFGDDIEGLIVQFEDAG